jgi:leucyl aminopeptidase
MNLELQTLTWAQAASLHTDALIVLVSQKQAKTTGLLATMLAQAEKSGDFAPTPGQCMLWWKPPGLNTQRLLFAGTGAGRAQDVRQAVTSAIQAVKKSNASKVTICLQDSHEPHLVVAAQAAADAAYVYTATKPSASAALVGCHGPLAQAHGEGLEQRRQLRLGQAQPAVASAGSMGRGSGLPPLGPRDTAA